MRKPGQPLRGCRRRSPLRTRCPKSALPLARASWESPCGRWAVCVRRARPPWRPETRLPRSTRPRVLSRETESRSRRNDHGDVGPRSVAAGSSFGTSRFRFAASIDAGTCELLVARALPAQQLGRLPCLPHTTYNRCLIQPCLLLLLLPVDPLVCPMSVLWRPDTSGKQRKENGGFLHGGVPVGDECAPLHSSALSTVRQPAIPRRHENEPGLGNAGRRRRNWQGSSASTGVRGR